ncbi:hypothetical protein [Streptomyces anthocyanicus]|uniref:hypothetical protein n=1 Tax=Streptomyces anthocyanicus TaxID=68174 RepID=UPI00386C086B|nr:hypothetical protein OH747_05725 [Streptomyces anthocyanicus]
MTGPIPSRLSPTAGLVNAMARLYIRRALPIAAAQQRSVDEARNLNHQLRTAASVRESKAAGYFDDDLEGP